MRLFDLGGPPGSEHEVHDRVLTVPNAITAVRLAGLPVFVWLVLAVESYATALALLAAIAATDWIDGYVARRFDQVSRLGAVLDPLVDRVLLATALLTLMAAGIVPGWVVVVVLLRDVLVLGGALALFGDLGPMPVSRAGKTSTAMLLVGVPLLLLAEVLGEPAVRSGALGLIVVGILAYYGAGLQYARAAVRLLGRGGGDDES